MLDPKIKKKWVESLRSGKYEQCYACMKNGPNSYCVLGVLCKVTGKRIKEGQFYPAGYEESKETGLPEPIPYAGLTSYQIVKLSDLNDNGVSFKELARYISRNL